MGNTCYYIGKLNLTELHIQRSRYYGTHHYETVLGKAYASFGFLLKGSAEMVYGRKQVQIPEGSLFYLPDRLRYRSVYSGNPDIEFIGLHFFGSTTELLTRQNYALQVLQNFSNRNTLALLEEIMALLSTNRPADQFKAIGSFLSFYAEVLPHLITEETVPYPAGLIKAMDHIEAHCCEPLSVQQLSEVCYLSPSRLYALFRKLLHTTPIHYLNQLRVERASALLRHSENSIQEIAEKCGFASDMYFREVFRQYTGLSPSDFRRKQKSDLLVAAKAQRASSVNDDILPYQEI